MPILRMTKITTLPEGNVLVDFDNGSTLNFENLDEMRKGYERFINVNQQGFLMWMMIGDYLRRGDDTIGADYNPENPSAVWVRRVN